MGREERSKASKTSCPEVGTVQEREVMAAGAHSPQDAEPAKKHSIL